MPSLTREQVVEYAFLVGFNILQDTCAEVQSNVDASGVSPCHGSLLDVDNEEEMGGAGEDDKRHEAREEAVSGLLYQIPMIALDNDLPGGVVDN
jgi:hypothetical protein